MVILSEITSGMNHNVINNFSGFYILIFRRFWRLLDFWNFLILTDYSTRF
jgi:hypothetical protein